MACGMTVCSPDHIRRRAPNSPECVPQLTLITARVCCDIEAELKPDEAAIRTQAVALPDLFDPSGSLRARASMEALTDGMATEPQVAVTPTHGCQCVHPPMLHGSSASASGSTCSRHFYDDPYSAT